MFCATFIFQTRSRAAKELVGTLKKELHVPLHLHTHDSTGNGVSTPSSTSWRMTVWRSSTWEPARLTA